MFEKRLYIHIGIHKTGTTTLQKMLLTNKEYLSELGLFYPSSCMHRAHHNVPWEIVNDDRWERERGTLADLKNEIEEHHYQNYLISSEDICILSSAQIKILHQHFEKYNPKIIVYIRNQYNYIVSSWSQLINTWKTTKSFKEHFDFCLTNKLNILNYNIFLERWATIFGKENLIIKLYEQNFEQPLEKSFLDIFNIDADLEKLEIGERLNLSMSFQKLNVLKAINKYKQKFDVVTQINFRKDVMDAINQNYNINENLVLPKDRSELRKQADDFFEDSNKQVAKDYFDRQYSL